MSCTDCGERSKQLCGSQAVKYASGVRLKMRARQEAEMSVTSRYTNRGIGLTLRARVMPQCEGVVGRPFELC